MRVNGRCDPGDIQGRFWLEMSHRKGRESGGWPEVVDEYVTGFVTEWVTGARLATRIAESVSTKGTLESWAWRVTLGSVRWTIAITPTTSAKRVLRAPPRLSLPRHSQRKPEVTGSVSVLRQGASTQPEPRNDLDNENIRLFTPSCRDSVKSFPRPAHHESKRASHEDPPDRI